jgi:deazaflavin-dependent oxidoreductase (nitroreductase family)
MAQNPPPSRPPGWQAEHTNRYVASNGEDGHMWEGVPTLLLTTTGRKSGKQFTTPLIYGEANGAYLIVASRGGAPDHPQWYKNLVEQPEVGLQIKADTFQAKARTANAEEKPALWKQMAAIWPSYDDYQKKTSREIPLVILERI